MSAANMMQQAQQQSVCSQTDKNCWATIKTVEKRSQTFLREKKHVLVEHGKNTSVLNPKNMQTWRLRNRCIWCIYNHIFQFRLSRVSWVLLYCRFCIGFEVWKWSNHFGTLSQREEKSTDVHFWFFSFLRRFAVPLNWSWSTKLPTTRYYHHWNHVTVSTSWNKSTTTVYSNNYASQGMRLMKTIIFLHRMT